MVELEVWADKLRSEADPQLGMQNRALLFLPLWPILIVWFGWSLGQFAGFLPCLRHDHFLHTAAVFQGHCCTDEVTKQRNAGEISAGTSGPLAGVGSDPHMRCAVSGAADRIGIATRYTDSRNALPNAECIQCFVPVSGSVRTPHCDAHSEAY